MKHRVYQVFTYVALAAMLFGFIYFFTAGYATSLGIDAALGTNLLAVLPGLLISIVGVLFISGMRGSFSVIGFGALSVGLATLLQGMYDGGIVVDAMLGGATLIQYQTIIVIMGLVLGGVVYAGGNR